MGIVLSFGEALSVFASSYMPACDLSLRTQEEYSRDLDDLAGFLRRQSINDWAAVTLPHLEAFLTHLERRGLKPSTCRRRVFAIKAFFTFLERQGAITHKPTQHLVPPTLPVPHPRVLIQSEYAALLDAIDDVRDRAIAMLFLQTGIRLSELVGLNLSDLDLPKPLPGVSPTTGTVQVTRRHGQVELLPVNWKAVQALEAWLERRQELSKQKNWATDALFVSKFGTRLSQRAIQLMMQKYLDQAGIRQASVHTLRHTMATHYLAKGGNIGAVQGMLGHAEVETTQQLYEELANRCSGEWYRSWRYKGALRGEIRMIGFPKVDWGTNIEVVNEPFIWDGS